jgi:1-acyl-sn-glycerol-3-phosphate acyltransferase
VIWIRSFGFAVATLITTAVFALIYPLILAPRRIVWSIVKVYIAVEIVWLRVICGIRYEVTGLENLPDGPCILASRHEAMWETIFLPWLLDNPAVFLKREILGYPLAGPVARKLGYIGVDRSGDLEAARQSFAQAREVTDAGRSVLIFPSGTRDPAQRSRVQTGVAVLYRQLGLPCVPVVLNSGDHWVYRSWLRRPGTIRVEFRPAIPAALPTRDFMARLERDLSSPPGGGD